MKTAKKLLLTTTMALALGSFIPKSQAATTNIDASVTTRPAVTVAQTSPMVFGTVDIDATTASGDLVLHTDGTVAYPTGVTNAPTGSTPAAAVITIGTDATSPLDITCATTGIMKSGTNVLNLSAVTIKAAASTPGTASLATDHVCTGSLEASLITPTAAAVVLNMGATIVGIGSTQALVAGNQVYDTTTGGTPVAFDVIYH